MFKKPLFHFKISEGGNSDMPKRNPDGVKHNCASLSEKVKVLDLSGNEKKMLRLLISMMRTNLLSVKL